MTHQLMGLIAEECQQQEYCDMNGLIGDSKFHANMGGSTQA